MILMPEIDGPKMAWFEDKDGEKYFYKVYAISRQGESPVEVMQAYATWRQDFDDPNMILVWRTRPELTRVEQTHDDNLLLLAQPFVYWKMYCRCVKIPFNELYTLPSKLEGVPTEFI